MSLAEKYLKKIPQYSRMERHARSVLGHGTMRKWFNLVQTEIERKLRLTEVRGRPYLMFLDPCNYCNLRCPLCPTGMGELGREQSMMSFDQFKRYLDPHTPYLFEVIMHNWGESMINKDIFRMIKYAQAQNIGTNLSSNLVTTTSEDIDNLLDSGLEYLVISLDGVDQESYVKYRVRGDFDRVVANLREIIRRKKERGLKYPIIEWQYIVMKHNEGRVEEAERLSQEIGVDVMRFIPVGLPFETEDRKQLANEWFPVKASGRSESDHLEQTYGQADKPSPCYYLYRSMTVNADGGVSPCCIVYKQKRDFGDLKLLKGNIDIGKVWNNDLFRSARSLYSKKSIPNRQRTVCDGCDIFKHHPSKEAKGIKDIPVTISLDQGKKP